MSTEKMTTRMIAGATAGLTSAFVAEQLREIGARKFPELVASQREDPGAVAVRRLTTTLPDGVAQRVPAGAIAVAADVAPLAYAATLTALYSVLRPPGANAFVEGAALGLAAWSTTHLTWFPSSGVTKPIGQQAMTQTVGEVGRHVAFGILAVSIYGVLARRLGDPPTGEAKDGLVY